MPLVKPSENFRGEVEPAAIEYFAQPSSVRHANMAARAVDHHLDWTFEYYKRTDEIRLSGRTTHGAFREEMFRRCGALKIMWELSDAAHHRFLEPRRTPRLVSSSTDAYVDVGTDLWVPDHNVLFWPTLVAAVEFWRAWRD
jgi:hypothetical protein